MLTGLSGQWWEQPQSHTGLNAAFCRASMVFFISVPSLIDSCVHKQWEDRQTSGIWRVQCSKFFIFGGFFEFLNIRRICMWVLGVFHGFLTPLKPAVLVHFWPAERTSHLSAQRKRWKTFLWRHIKTPLSMVPSSSHEATSGLSPAPLTPLPCMVQGSSQPQLYQKSCWRWDGRTPSSSTSTEEPPKSVQRMTGNRPNLEPKCRRLPHGSC